MELFYHISPNRQQCVGRKQI